MAAYACNLPAKSPAASAAGQPLPGDAYPKGVMFLTPRLSRSANLIQLIQ
jgi:hypothetical protein